MFCCIIPTEFVVVHLCTNFVLSSMMKVQEEAKDIVFGQVIETFTKGAVCLLLYNSKSMKPSLENFRPSSLQELSLPS